MLVAGLEGSELRGARRDLKGEGRRVRRLVLHSGDDLSRLVLRVEELDPVLLLHGGQLSNRPW